MTPERIHQLRPFPNFKGDLLPESEASEAGAIRINIGDLHRRSTSFWAAKMLFQNCAERKFFDLPNERTYHEWQLCAGRDAIMSIYHFGRILEGIDISLGRCPNLRGLINESAKSQARKRFERQFPAFITLRNAIAHSAERAKTAIDAKRHGKITAKTLRLNPEVRIKISNDATILLVHDGIYGTTFSSMWEGQLLKCDISDQSGKVLDAITESYWSAFDPIIDQNPEDQPTVTLSSEPTPGLG